MKIFREIKSYINEDTYRINVINNKINIINYIEIKSFSDNKIIIKHKEGYTTITGKELIISKMYENEILITGTIKALELR